MRPIAIGMTIQAATAAYASTPAGDQQKPLPGDFFGYQFDWGPMIAGLLACLAVRFYVAKTEPEHRWTIDAPVTLLTLLFTAAVIQGQRPIPLFALLYGTGIGAFGVGIIKVALSFVTKNLGAFGQTEPPDEKTPPA